MRVFFEVFSAPEYVHLNPVTLEQTPNRPAAKRRKNPAHGASRGQCEETDKPQRGERLVQSASLLWLRLLRRSLGARSRARLGRWRSRLGRFRHRLFLHRRLLAPPYKKNRLHTPQRLSVSFRIFRQIHQNIE